MQPFVFTAKTPTGGRSVGFRDAKSKSALAEQLRKEKMTLGTAYGLPRAFARSGKIKPSDNLVLNEQLAQLLSRGVPLVEALEVVAETVTPAARATVVKMREMVAAGSSFSDCCRDLGVFDTVTVAVYKAAERSGDLAGAARQIAITTRRTLTVAGRAVTLMVYPIIVMTISVFVAFGMLTLVVPKLGPALKEMNADLPWFSKAIIGLGTAMSENLLIIGVLLVAAVTALVYFRKQIARGVVVTARKTPLLRDVLTTQEAVRFFSVMAAMSRSGVPLADAMGTANQTITHPAMRKQMERLRTRLIEGGQWRTLVEEVSSLPVATRKLLIAAERSGDLEAAFNSLAMDMTEELDRRSSRFLAVLQPLMVVVMFGLIGSLLMSLLVPLITMGTGR